MIGRLPTSLTVKGKSYPIRSDYRNILDTFLVFNDTEMSKEEKWFCAVYMIFEKFTCADDLEAACMEGFDIAEAIEQIIWFINCGKESKESQKKPVYDWEQDEQIIFSAVNNVAKTEVRQVEYMHWWTFLSYFNEIGEGLFSYIVGIRRKRNGDGKLDKSERKFLAENKDMVEIRPRLSKEEQEFERYIGELL